MIDAVARDLRIAARGLRRNPDFAAVAMVTLAFRVDPVAALRSE